MENTAIDYFKLWPKIDLHRHLEGAMRINTIRDLAVAAKLHLPYEDTDAFSALFMVTPDDERSLTKFISKFTWLRKLISDREVLARITFEAIEDAALDNVKYLELRFNYYALINRGLQARDIMQGLSEGISYARHKYDIDVGLICGIGRDLPVECAHQTVEFAVNNLGNGIVAVDLMNDERFPPEPFEHAFKKALAAGLFATAHAGEAAGPENIIQSINLLGATRIGHGTHIFWDDEAAKLALERNVMIECCLTSNVQTGAVDNLRNHPFSELLNLKIPVSLNTDDPGVSAINLSHEYWVARDHLDVSENNLKNVLLNSVQHIFRPECMERLHEKLEAYFCKEVMSSYDCNQETHRN